MTSRGESTDPSSEDSIPPAIVSQANGLMDQLDEEIADMERPDGRHVNFNFEGSNSNTALMSTFDETSRSALTTLGGSTGSAVTPNLGYNDRRRTSEEETSDDYNPIDTIFTYLDPTKTGKVTVQDMKCVLQSIGETNDNNVLSQVLLTKATRRKSGTLTKSDLRRALYSQRTRTRLQKAALWVVLWVLPAFYSASTRLPFICLAVEVIQARQGSLWQVSVLLGTYQACRALANALISLAGGPDPMRRLHVPMVLIGLLGWALAGLPQFTSSVWALFALCGVGLSESIVNLQTTLIHETRAESVANIADPTLLQSRIRSQYAAVAGGVLFFWLLGGWLYTTQWGFQAISVLGIACHVAQLIGTFYFRHFALSQALRQQRKKHGSKRRETEATDLLSSDGKVFLRSVTYRVKAMNILATEAKDVFTGAPSKVSSVLDEAAALAKDDAVLQSSLKRLYRSFFNKEKGSNHTSTSSEEHQPLNKQPPRRASLRLSIHGSSNGTSQQRRASLRMSIQGMGESSRRSSSRRRMGEPSSSRRMGNNGSPRRRATDPTAGAASTRRRRGSTLQEKPKRASAPAPTKGRPDRRTSLRRSDSVDSIESMFMKIKRASGGNLELSQHHDAFEAHTTLDCAKVAVELMDMDGDGNVSEREFVDYLAPRVYREVFQLTFSTQDNGKPVNIIWPYMKAVVFTQAIMALCIGTFLSTALLMYTERFHVTTATVGLLLAIGEGLGAGLICLNSLPSFQQWSRKRNTNPKENNKGEPGILATITSRPLHVPIVLFLVGGASAGFASPVFAGAVFCQMVMSMLNDQSVSFLNELIATSIPSKEFRKYQGLGQWLRRLGNVVTGILGPFLFGIHQNLPFLLFGSIVIFWGIILWYLLYRQAAKIRQDQDNNQDSVAPEDPPGCAAVIMEPFNPFRETSRTPWHVLEQRYFAANKEEIEEALAPTRAQALNLAVLDFRMRRMGAYHRMLELKLKKEHKARRGLEARLHMLEDHDEDNQGIPCVVQGPNASERVQDDLERGAKRKNRDDVVPGAHNCGCGESFSDDSSYSSVCFSHFVLEPGSDDDDSSVLSEHDSFAWDPSSSQNYAPVNEDASC